MTKLLQALLFLFLLSSNYILTLCSLSADQAQEMFVSETVKESMIPIVRQAWEDIKKAEKSEDINKESFRQDILWNDIILNRLRPIHEELKKIDKNVEEHSPSRILNSIVDLLDFKKLVATTKLVTTNKQVSLTDYWREGWVKLSSLLIQLHHKYDWVFGHIYKEGFPVNLDHELMDDIITLLDLEREDLPYKNRNHYTWLRINSPARGKNYEQFLQTLDEVAGFTNVTIVGKKLEYNMFVGLRRLMKLRPDLTDVYKDVKSYNDTKQCLGEEQYAGMEGVDYEIPIYVLLYILNAEMKYYLVQNFAEMHKCVILRNCRWNRVSGLERHLLTYHRFYITEMIKAFAITNDPIPTAPASAWRWSCDPPSSKPSEPRNYIEGESYARLYDFDTRFFAEERDLSLTQTCRDTCDMFDGAFSTVPCEEDDWSCLETDDDFDCWEHNKMESKCPAPARKLCPNEGLLCTTTKIKNAKVCAGQTKGRHIEWFESDGGAYQSLGEKKRCHSLPRKMRAEHIPERSGITKYEPQQCEICLCRCYEPLGNDTHRYISIVPQMSHIDSNRVIVGLQLVKIHNQIHISIADAPLTPHGMVKKGRAIWTFPQGVDITNNSQVFRLGRDSRTILLDDLTTPLGYAITGVRFKPVVLAVDRYHEKELRLQIHVTKIGENGDLLTADSGWVFNNNDSRQRDEISLENLDPPTLAILPSLPVSQSNAFLKVQSSSLKTDVGQTPVPFFDTQKVSFEGSETLIRGVGLYLKSVPGYGGFLGFRIIPSVKQDLPNDDRYDLWYFAQKKNLWNISLT